MPNPGDAARNADIRFEAKGSALRGLLALLRDEGRFDAALAWASAPTRLSMLDPPGVLAPVEGRVMAEIQSIIADRFGLPYLRTLGREAVMHTTVPLLRPAIERLLAAFGASPATLFARSGMLVGLVSRGIVFEYRPRGPRSGELRVSYPRSRAVPYPVFVFAVGALDLIFQLAGAPDGKASDPEIVPDDDQNSAIISLSW